MALPATADFTGADATAIRTLANWDGCTSGATGGACQILANRAVAATNLVVACDWWTGDAFDNDQKSSATVTALANGTYIGVAVRCSGTDNGGNVTAYVFYSDSSDGCYLEKYVGGTYSALAGPGTVFSVNDTIEISVSGTAITCKVNGVTRLSATDSSIASGAPGIVAYSNGTSTLDNWTGDNLTAATVHPIAAWFKRRPAMMIDSWRMSAWAGFIPSAFQRLRSAPHRIYLSLWRPRMPPPVSGCTPSA